MYAAYEPAQSACGFEVCFIFDGLVAVKSDKSQAKVDSQYCPCFG